MERSIRIVWSAGLGGALVGTLVILKEVALVTRSLRGILRLVNYTREAAEGVRSNAATISNLAEVDKPTSELREAASSLAAATSQIEHNLATLVDGAAERGD